MNKRSWDDRWHDKQNEPIPAADDWLTAQRNLLTGDVALDLACGRGRNSLWLAERGFKVYAVDSAAAALDLLQTANEDQTQILPIHHDLSVGLPELPRQPDLILCSYFLDRRLFAAIKAQLKPDGLFIGRSFCQLQTCHPPQDVIYNPGELAQLFADWTILRYEEGKLPSHRGGTLAGIVVRKS